MLALQRNHQILLGLIGLILGVTLILPGQKPTPTTLHQTATSSGSSRAVIAAPHLNWAATETERAIEEHLKSLASLFEEAKKNTPAFADEALGWLSKWYVIKQFVPYSKKGEHERYIAELFEKHIFKKEVLPKEIAQVVQTYLRDVESIESTMLVRIRSDIADLAPSAALSDNEVNEFNHLFEKTIQTAIRTTQTHATQSVSTEIEMLIASEILTGVVVKLGTSAGILGTSGALSLKTLGISLVIGVIVDWIVSKIWNWWSDPQGELAKHIADKLDDLHSLIVDGAAERGENDAPPVVGLRDRLHQLARERTQIRNNSLLSILNAH